MESCTLEMKDSVKDRIVFVCAVVTITIGTCVTSYWQRTLPIKAEIFKIANYLCKNNESLKELHRGWSEGDWVIKCNNGAEFRDISIEISKKIKGDNLEPKSNP